MIILHFIIDQTKVKKCLILRASFKNKIDFRVCVCVSGERGGRITSKKSKISQYYKRV